MNITDIENKIEHLENQLESTQNKLKYWRTQLDYYKELQENNEKFKIESDKFTDDLIKTVNEIASGFYGKNIDITSKSKEREFVYPRNYYCWFMNQKFGSNLSYIGRTINRTHATVINCIRTHDNLVKSMDFEYTTLVKRFIERL